MNRIRHFTRERIKAPQVIRFVEESNRIEGIEGTPNPGEIMAMRNFLEIPSENGLEVSDMEQLAHTFVGRGSFHPGLLLRAKRGMDVYIRHSDHRPPPGSRKNVTALARLLDRVSKSPNYTPFQAHRAYESLHPFMDGNGRTGRALWAWHMIKHGRNPFELGFLHTYYYQSLEEGPRWIDTTTP